MYAEERQQSMAGLVTRRGRMSVVELAVQYDVTTETVRRDLSSLERAGVVRRVHGGAVPAGTLTVLETAYGERVGTRSEQKDRVAEAALALLPSDGGSLVIDAGSTTTRLAALLPRDRRLTVFTHAVPVASSLVGLPHVTLHLLPGEVRRTTQAAVGEVTVAALRQLRVDVAFVGTNGVTVAHGFSTPDASEAATKRAIVGSATQVVVVADSDKVGRERTHRFADLPDVDVLVTDTEIDRRDAEALTGAGLEVRLT